MYINKSNNKGDVMRKRRRDDVYELVSKNIKNIRKSKNLTQAQLAEKAGYSHVTIRKIEGIKNKKYFSIDTISNIADALEIDIRELFKIN